MMHEMIQSYFDSVYHSFDSDIKQSMTFKSNETYGEIYYYSLVKLLTYLEITEQDHFLDIGYGLGKLIFYIFFTTRAASVTGIEINDQRHDIASRVRDTITQQLPAMFNNGRTLNLFNGDFLKQSWDSITIIYVCSSVFSFELLSAMGKKINDMSSVQRIVSFRKLPHLDQFKLTKKIFLHCSWDNVPCFIYSRKS